MLEMNSLLLPLAAASPQEGGAAASKAAGQVASQAGIQAATESPAQLSPADVRALVGKRSELTSQLSTQVSRSRSIMNDLRNAPAEARPALGERYNVVGAGIVELEKDILAINQQLANAPPSALSQIPSTAPPPVPRGMSDEAMVLSVLMILFVLAPISIAIAFRIIKRAFRRNEPARDAEQSQRLKRMEHAVDAVAIEVERISEGQRFLTQLFAGERQSFIAEGVVIPDRGEQQS